MHACFFNFAANLWIVIPLTNKAARLVGHKVIYFLPCCVNLSCNSFNNVVFPLPPGPVTKHD